MAGTKSGQLVLAELAKGLHGLTPYFGGILAEAGAICFESQNHPNGVALQVNGTFEGRYQVFWQQVTEQMVRCWNDTEDATEHAAYAVAILLMLDLTEYTVIERSRRGTGFDYWLGRAEDSQGLPFQKSVRLEVSGIRMGDDSLVRTRVNQKLKQVALSDSTYLPAYIVVIEFGSPLARVAKK